MTQYYPETSKKERFVRQLVYAEKNGTGVYAWRYFDRANCHQPLPWDWTPAGFPSRNELDSELMAAVRTKTKAS